MEAAISVNPRPRPKAVYGIRQSTLLRAGPRRHEIFIFNVDQDVKEDSIREFLTGEGVKVHDLECKSREGAWTKSYRVTVELNDINTLYQPDFWPDGIGCKRYWPRRNTSQT